MTIERLPKAGRIADAFTRRTDGTAAASGGPQSHRNAARLPEHTQTGETAATAPTDAVRGLAPIPKRPPSAAGAAEPSHTPDRLRPRSGRDSRAAASGCGRAVAVVPAVLGKNTSNVSPIYRNPRANRYRLRLYLRGVQAARQAKCGYCRTRVEGVGIGMKDGRARFQNLVRCGSVWACPVCSATIRSERAADVGHIYEWHRQQGGSLYMLTLTIRHGLGDDLKAIRRGVANAWRFAQGGKLWTALRKQMGISGYVRALEVTHGKHGWHPHLHILLLLPQLSDQQTVTLRRRLSARWQSGVSRALGEDHVPNDHIGCNLVPAHQAEYITKLGLEISDVGAKAGRQGNRTPWEIAADFADGGRERDGALWKGYAAGMKGARMLTYSRGLRAAAGLGVELTDEQLVEAEEAQQVEAVYVMDHATWKAVRDGEPWRLLSAAEQGGSEAVHELLCSMMRPPP